MNPVSILSNKADMDEFIVCVLQIDGHTLVKNAYVVVSPPRGHSKPVVAHFAGSQIGVDTKMYISKDIPWMDCTISLLVTQGPYLVHAGTGRGWGFDDMFEDRCWRGSVLRRAPTGERIGVFYVADCPVDIHPLPNGGEPRDWDTNWTLLANIPDSMSIGPFSRSIFQNNYSTCGINFANGMCINLAMAVALGAEDPANRTSIDSFHSIASRLVSLGLAKDDDHLLPTFLTCMMLTRRWSIGPSSGTAPIPVSMSQAMHSEVDRLAIAWSLYSTLSTFTLVDLADKPLVKNMVIAAQTHRFVVYKGQIFDDDDEEQEDYFALLHTKDGSKKTLLVSPCTLYRTDQPHIDHSAAVCDFKALEESKSVVYWSADPATFCMSAAPVGTRISDLWPECTASMSNWVEHPVLISTEAKDHFAVCQQWIPYSTGLVRMKPTPKDAPDEMPGHVRCITSEAGEVAGCIQMLGIGSTYHFEDFAEDFGFYIICDKR
jgi:hypothetical protein